jgi:hypothetical protein
VIDNGVTGAINSGSLVATPGLKESATFTLTVTNQAGKSVSRAIRVLVSAGAIETTSSALSEAMIQPFATALPVNGRVLIGPSFTGTVSVYDPATATFTSAQNSASPHSGAGAVRLGDGSVVFSAGSDASSNYVVATDVYSPKTNSFTPGKVFPANTSSPFSALLPNGRGFFAGGTPGGSSTYLWDPITPANNWISGPSLPTGRPGPGYDFMSLSVPLDNGLVLLPAGYASNPSAYPKVDLFDFRTKSYGQSANSVTNSYRVSAGWIRLPTGRVLAVGGFNSTFDALATTDIYDPATNQFTTGAGLGAPRIYPNVAALPDGRVLVAFGASGKGTDPSCNCLGSAEIFDPTSGQFFLAPAFNSVRNAAALITLPNGRVLFAGGKDGGAGSAAVLVGSVFDPQDYTPHTWSQPPAAAASLATPRTASTATALGDGRVLVVGGKAPDGTLPNRTELFDSYFQSGTATTSTPSGVRLALGPNLTTPRTNHTATRLYDGGVLIAGGLDSTGAPTAAELYSFTYYQPGALAPTATAMTPRSSHAAISLPDGRVLIAGGIDASGNVLNTAVLYCPAADLLSGSCTVTGKFDPAGNTMSTARAGHTMTLLGDGRVMIAGGSTTASGFAPNPSGATSTVEFFDWKTSKFVSSAATLSTARLFHTATLDPLGAVVFTGGTGASGSVLASTERYDENTDAFDGASPPLSPARSGHQAVLLPWGQVLIAGGVDGSGTPLNSTQFLDFYDHTTTLALGIAPASRAFATVGAMSTARAGFSLVLLGNGRVLAVGGTDGAKPVGGLEWFK